MCAHAGLQHEHQELVYSLTQERFQSFATENRLQSQLPASIATLMLEEGVPMRVVAEQMGHSSTRITEQTYSHVTARLQAEAGAAVERALGGI